jgi:uncharacterized LabA/DUF88 family protein
MENRIIEPLQKRVCAFFDGQNLFHAVKEAFGYSYPNFDPIALAQDIAYTQGWQIQEVRFYTGIPSANIDPAWNKFWNAKLQALGSKGVFTFTRPLRYQRYESQDSNGVLKIDYIPQEKGIDVRIAIDIVRGALRNEFDVALLFSQDQDLSEVADEIRNISKQQQRWIKIVSAFPDNHRNGNNRGINKTDWIRISKSQYDKCIDYVDYR